jgi:hypothetical protein
MNSKTFEEKLIVEWRLIIMLDVHTNKKTYLVYQVGSCEMGSEGWSNRYYPCIAQGNTKQEVIDNWVENVKIIYGHILNPVYHESTATYVDYYPIYMNELVLSVYGDAQPYEIINCYKQHKAQQ